MAYETFQTGKPTSPYSFVIRPHYVSFYIVDVYKDGEFQFDRRQLPYVCDDFGSLIPLCEDQPLQSAVAWLHDGRRDLWN